MVGSLQRKERATTLSPSSPHSTPGLLLANNPEPSCQLYIHVIPGNKDNQIARYQGGVRSLGGREHGKLPTLEVCTSREPFKSNDRSAAVSHGWQGRSTENRHRSLRSGPAGKSRGGSGGSGRPPPGAAPTRPRSPRPRGARQPELGSPHALPLSRESCAGPSRGGGGGAQGTAAMERLEQCAGASQSAASHGHIKMPY